MTEQLIKKILTEELFGYSVYESVQDVRIVTYFYNRLLLEKLLHGEPISVPELRKLLRQKIVNFEFIKLDGEVRPAKGTTMMKYIPPKDHPKGIRPSSPKVATFFDLDKDAWRSVSKRSKEIVIKKDEETGKPIIVVKDTPKVKVKVISKERESTDTIEQGKSYKYTTNRGTNTDIEILRELPNGMFQVSSPLFKTTFAIDPNRIGDEFTPKEPKEEPEIKVDEPTKEPEVKEPEVKEPEVKEPKIKEKPDVLVKDVEPMEKPTPKPPKEKIPEKPAPVATKPPIPQVPETPTTVIIPNITSTPPEKEDQTKAPPMDITPPGPGTEDLPGEADEGPEELKK